MKNKFRNKMIQIMMMTVLTTQGFNFLPDASYQWEIKEEQKVETITELSAPDGEDKQGYEYVLKGKKEFVAEDDVLVFSGAKKNEIKTIVETFVGRGPNNQLFYATETRYEIHIQNKLIAKEAAETDLGEEE